jgi:hypothetical protein
LYAPASPAAFAVVANATASAKAVRSAAIAVGVPLWFSGKDVARISAAAARG